MNFPDFIMLQQTVKDNNVRFSHVTHVYQNCQRANGLDEPKNQNIIIAMNTFWKNSSGLWGFTRQDS